MNYRLLSKTEKELFGADVVVTLLAADVAALGAATNGAAINIVPSGTDTLPAGTKVQLVGMRLITPFDCTGTGNLTLSVGYGGAETAFLAATQVALDGTEILYSAGTGTSYAFTVADTVDAFFDSSGVNLDVYTVGEVALFLKVDDLNRLPTV